MCLHCVDAQTHHPAVAIRWDLFPGPFLYGSTGARTVVVNHPDQRAQGEVQADERLETEALPTLLTLERVSERPPSYLATA
jgi:hypothetical protein